MLSLVRDMGQKVCTNMRTAQQTKLINILMLNEIEQRTLKIKKIKSVLENFLKHKKAS